MLLSQLPFLVADTYFSLCVRPEAHRLCCRAEGPGEEEVGRSQEEAAVFMEDTSFMQGAVGLTLMPSAPSTRTPNADLASLARLIFGSDKLYGFFCSV